MQKFAFYEEEVTKYDEIILGNLPLFPWLVASKTNCACHLLSNFLSLKLKYNLSLHQISSSEMSLPNSVLQWDFCNYSKMLPRKNMWNTSECSADEGPEVPQEVRKSTTRIVFFVSVGVMQHSWERMTAGETRGSWRASLCCRVFLIACVAESCLEGSNCQYESLHVTVW